MVYVMVPILSAIHSWKNMEILHLNTTQAFDSDYELLIDSGCWQRFKKSSLSSSDSELDESEKRPSEASLDFLISWLINSSARNLQFLRGDWKLSHRSCNSIWPGRNSAEITIRHLFHLFRKYSEVLARLAAGGIDSRLVVKVINCFF